MKSYVISQKKPDFSWEQIPRADLEHTGWLPDTGVKAWAQLAYDAEYLYVRMGAEETDIHAEFTSILDQPCMDSCLEFFVSPMPGEDRYFNVEFNPNKCMYLGIGSGKNDLVRLLPDDGKTAFGSPEAERTENGWQICYQIPADFVRLFFPDFVLQPGRKLRANFYKCGELCKERHYMAWNPVNSETPNFHRPWDFGELILGA